MAAFEVMHRLHQCQVRLERVWNTLAPGRVTFQQAVLLTLTLRRPNLRPVEMQRVLALDKSVTQKMYRMLEARGYLERQRDNGQTTRVRLTGPGRKTAKSFLQVMDQLSLVFWGDLPESDLEAAARVVTQLMERSR